MQTKSYPVDSRIAVFIDAALGATDPMFPDGEVQALLAQASREAWAGIDGSTIRSRVGNKLDALVKNELIKRFDHVILYPGVYFRSRIEQVLHDIALTELPPAPKVSFAAPAQTDSAEATRKVRAARFRESFGREGTDWEIDQFFRNLEAFVSEHKRQPARTDKLTHFAFVINSQIREQGIRSLQPRSGIVTITEQGRKYDYPYLGPGNFKEKYDEALLFNLIS